MQKKALRKKIIHTLLVLFAIAGFNDIIHAQNQIAKSIPETDISPNQLIASPLTIEINSKGFWMAHEGELGVVTLLSAKDEKLATAIMKTKDGDWMVTGDALFLAELEFETSGTLTGKLRFENRVITSEGSSKEEHFEVPVRYYQPPVKTYYFGSNNKAEETISGNGYHFIKLEIASDSSFHGIEIHAPFGTDGSRSSVHGHFSNNTFTGEANMLAEGEIYAQKFSLKLHDNLIELGYNLPTGETATLPELSKETFENLAMKYENKFLLSRMNTSVRGRLNNLDIKTSFGFTDEDITKMNFIELEIDLNGSYQTREFLLYPFGPMLCGSGGCNLYIVNEEGKILSETTVVKMPVYTTTNRAVNPVNAKPGWKDLYVWSNGAFRRLIFNNGSYTSNASMAPGMGEENLVNNPQKFIKIMDFVD